MSSQPKLWTSRALAATLLLASCADVITYQPYTPKIGVRDYAAWDADKKHCLAVAKGLPTPAFDAAGLAQAAGEGAAQNLTTAATVPASAPVVLGAGAAGSAGSLAISMLGIGNNNQIRVLYDCLKRHGDRSGAYEVYDPSLP